MTLISSFTFQKSIDGGSGFGIVDGGFPAPQDNYNFRAERSLSQFDRTRRFVAGWVYQIPLASQSRGIVGMLCSRWELSGNLELTDGTPVTITNTPNLTNSLGGGSRPNRAPDVNPVLDAPTPQRWLNTGAFVAPVPFTFGAVSRTEPQLRNPAWRYLDLSLLKTFPLSERFRLQFRAESYNTTNTANFRSPVSALGVPQFGQILAANPARRIQLGLRFEF